MGSAGQRVKRLREPSTWAALAAIVSALGPLWFTQPQVAAAVAGIGALGVLLREKGAPAQ